MGPISDQARNGPSGGGTRAPEQVLQSADEFLIRPLKQSGFELVIGLPALPDLGSLQLLVGRRDRHLLIERAASWGAPAESNGFPPENVNAAIRKVAAILWGWEKSGESDLSGAGRIVRTVLQELVAYGPAELEQFDAQLSRLFPDV
jgi:hypothetical protein